MGRLSSAVNRDIFHAYNDAMPTTCKYMKEKA